MKILRSVLAALALAAAGTSALEVKPYSAARGAIILGMFGIGAARTERRYV